MRKHPWKLKVVIGMIALGVMVLGYSFQGKNFDFSAESLPAGIFGSAEAVHQDGRVFTINSEQEEFISKMSREVRVGDRLVTNEGDLYEIQSVKGTEAVARHRGKDEKFVEIQSSIASGTVPVAQENQKSNKVGIYHTHSEESYVPTDNTSSDSGRGGIYDVGESFAKTMEGKGVEVVHDKSVHQPRDQNSYNRSRRTAANLVEQNPVSIIDIHRDGVPDASYYKSNIEGEEVTQLRLVVGRQNPNQEANKEFAKRVMAGVNEEYPGLIKEIFMGSGNYNQDLEPTALLVEAGTFTNQRENAENGISMLADALPGVLGIGQAGTPAGTYGDPNTSTPGGWATIGIILGLVIVGGGLFLVISSGGIGNAKERLNKYISREMVNLLSPRRKNKK